MRATKKLLDRIGPPNLGDQEQSTTLMGQWYATAIFWKPQVALFVSEPTLLPVLMPLAPAATLLARFPRQATAALAAHRTPQAIIDQELRQMRDRRLAKTANRSVVGIMNEFTFLAEAYPRRHSRAGPAGPGDTPGDHALQPSLQQAHQSRSRTGRAVALLRTASELTSPTPTCRSQKRRLGRDRKPHVHESAVTLKAWSPALLECQDGWLITWPVCEPVEYEPAAGVSFPELVFHPGRAATGLSREGARP